MYIPPTTTKTKKCLRCGLNYPLEVDECVHCSEISDEDLSEFLALYRKEDENLSRYGKITFFCGVLILITLALFI